MYLKMHNFDFFLDFLITVQHIRAAAAVDDIAAATPFDMVVVALRRTRLQKVARTDELVARSTQNEIVELPSDFF